MGNLANILKMNREIKNLTGTDAAKLLKIDASLLNRFEKGNRLPSKEQLINIWKEG